MTAADRLAALDSMPATDLCARTETALNALVDMMSRETMALRAGRLAEAAPLGAQKASLAEAYVSLSRAVKRQIERCKTEAPESIVRLRAGHERLATQMADNLRVLATARELTEDLLTDVARAAGAGTQTRTYGANGQIGYPTAQAGRGLSVNRAL